MLQNHGNLTAKFYSSSGLLKWLTGLFVALAISYIIGVAFYFYQANLLSTVSNGGYISEAQASSNDYRIFATFIIQVLIQISTGILFLIWVFRINKNLAYLSWYSTRFSAGWAVAYFFIPILGLYRPYQVMKEVVENSDSRYDPNNGISPSTFFVGLWWAFFLVFDVLGNIASRILSGSDTPTEYLTSTWVSIAFNIVGMLGTLVTIYLIRRISNLQNNRHQQLTAENTNMPQTVETPAAY